ncbi:MAG: hypothetical protein KDA84_07655 [Planctomycetaceae bacterium]|nr:hypothetical protein [Planctomycetaceae bacterium]
MGSTFRYIADEAMYPCGGTECHHCERDDVPIYDFRGVIVDPSLAKNPQLAIEEPEVSELCADCVLSGNIIKDPYEISRIQGIVNTYARDKDAAIANYHTIPHIPLMMQDEDWPMCCGDWCEFQGCPPDYAASVQVPSLHRYWDRRPKNPHWDFELKPESLREVNIFRCFQCKTSYFIWQPT